jgi:hypothetical protein
MKDEFTRQLPFGGAAESLIIRFLIARGNGVLPVYELETDWTSKGPRLLSADGQLIAPDALVLNRNRCLSWAEVKRKSHFTWHRNSGCWTTGIDRRCFEHYLEIRRRYDFELYLFFLHDDPVPSPEDQRRGCPARCPAGLFCGEIEELQANPNHTSGNYGRGGMIYWRAPRAGCSSPLKLVASMDEVMETIARMPPATDWLTPRERAAKEKLRSVLRSAGEA